MRYRLNKPIYCIYNKSILLFSLQMSTQPFKTTKHNNNIIVKIREFHSRTHKTISLVTQRIYIFTVHNLAIDVPKIL